MPTRRRQDNRQVVGEWIRDRRVELGMTIDQLAEAADLSSNTIGNAERGQTTIQPLSRAKIERALQWLPGSLKAAYDRAVQPKVIEEATPADHELDVVVFAPELAELLNDPRIDDVSRQRMLTRLQTLHHTFVMEAKVWLGLDEQDPSR